MLGHVGRLLPGDDMFLYTKQMLRAAIRDTPDGRVYFPSGRAGYRIDTPTEDRLARFLTFWFFAQIAIIMVFVPLGSQTNHRVLAILACMIVLMALRDAGLRWVLRGSPRVAAPMPREDAVRRAASAYGSGRICAMAFIVLLLASTFPILFRSEPPWERAIGIAIGAAAAIYVLVFAVRVLRAKAAMPGVAADGDRA